MKRLQIDWVDVRKQREYCISLSLNWLKAVWTPENWWGRQKPSWDSRHLCSPRLIREVSPSLKLNYNWSEKFSLNANFSFSNFADNADKDSHQDWTCLECFHSARWHDPGTPQRSRQIWVYQACWAEIFFFLPSLERIPGSRLYSVLEN